MCICNAEPEEKFFLQTRHICLLFELEEEGEPVKTATHIVVSVKSLD